ncbi:hypothetical protein BDR03DRAFT_955904 [Suillus americanus]|nr:hypothetical protein BDR03DRAFT_955904 [Suillus americanus]
MKSTSLANIVISAIAMAGVAIASDDLNVTPMFTPCEPASEHFCGLRADCVLTVIHRFCAVLNDRHARLQQRERLRLSVRT